MSSPPKLSVLVEFYACCYYYRGKTSFDQAGVGAEMPGEVSSEDDTFDTYRKRMMLAYRFRPNPLVSYNNYHGLHVTLSNVLSQNNPRRPYY